MVIRKVESFEKEIINEIVFIHLNTFVGFFLTFLGQGFLFQMYRSYSEEKKSGLLVAIEQGEILGFLAYSGNMSGLYKYMIKKRLLIFAWYSLGAFLRQPGVFIRLLRAFLKPSESQRTENYVELASIGVLPSMKSKGVGSKLIDELKSITDFQEYTYITLETDAVNNENSFSFHSSV